MLGLGLGENDFNRLCEGDDCEIKVQQYYVILEKQVIFITNFQNTVGIYLPWFA